MRKLENTAKFFVWGIDRQGVLILDQQKSSENPNDSIRSIAVMIGSLIPDFVFSKVQPMLFLACAITINGVALAMIPTFTNIIIFNVCITVTGFTFGIVDMGIQLEVLTFF